MGSRRHQVPRFRHLVTVPYTESAATVFLLLTTQDIALLLKSFAYPPVWQLPQCSATFTPEQTVPASDCLLLIASACLLNLLASAWLVSQLTCFLVQLAGTLSTSSSLSPACRLRLTQAGASNQPTPTVHLTEKFIVCVSVRCVSQGRAPRCAHV